MTQQARHFRYTFLPVWRLQTTVTTAAVFATRFLLAWLTGRPIERPDLLMSLSISVFCALILAVVTATVRFQVCPEGLRTFNTIGQWRLVPWSEISRAEPGRYYFLPHLKLRADGRRLSLWVPLFLSDMAGFRRAVVGTAGADHPVARALPVPPSIAERLAADAG